MDHDAVFGSRDQHEFSKVVDVEVGEHQFKFRLGHGDWWIVDESAPTVTDGLGNVNNVIQVHETKEPETKVVEVTEQSVPVKKEEPAPKAAVEEDKSVAHVFSKQDELSRAVPVAKADPVPEASSTKKESTPDVPVKEDKSSSVAPAKEIKPAMQRVFSKETLSTIKTTTSELTAVVNDEVSSVQSMLRNSVESVQTPSKQVPETPAQKSQTQNGQLNGAQKPIVPQPAGQPPTKKSADSFIKKICSCFTGKTAFGMAAVSAVLVAVYIRR